MALSNYIRWNCFLLLILLVLSCKNEQKVMPSYVPSLMEIPQGFPDLEFPEGNEFSATRWALGKKLFAIAFYCQ